MISLKFGHFFPSARCEFAVVIAKFFTFSRTTAMPRSSDAFNSQTRSLAKFPNISRAIARIVLVFPVPGAGVHIRIFAQFGWAVGRTNQKFLSECAPLSWRSIEKHVRQFLAFDQYCFKHCNDFFLRTDIVYSLRTVFFYPREDS